MSLMFTDSLILIGLLSVAGAVVWGVLSIRKDMAQESIANCERSVNLMQNHVELIATLGKLMDKLTPPVQSLPEDYSPLPPMYLNDGETLEHLAGVVDGTEGSVLGAVGLHL